jgi:hypothetical protein
VENLVNKKLENYTIDEDVMNKFRKLVRLTDFYVLKELFLTVSNLFNDHRQEEVYLNSLE